jgi:argininosuccinate lyase
MPQKRNPDVAELTRGKSARSIGNLTALLTLLKGLPLTYNRDLQEDKERLFDTADTVRASVRLMSGMLAHTQVNAAACRAAAADPQLLATDLADHLVRRGVPFRKAHHAVGAAVALAERLGQPLDRLTLDQLRSLVPEFGEDALAVFDLDRALERRTMPGAPSRRGVRNELQRWQRALGIEVRPRPRRPGARP